MTSFQSIAASKNTSLAWWRGIAEGYLQRLWAVRRHTAAIFYTSSRASEPSASGSEGFAGRIPAILSRQVDERT